MTKERTAGWYDAERMLYDYKINLDLLDRAEKQARADAFYSTPKPSDGMPHGNTTSDPTARAVERMASSSEVLAITAKVLPVEMMLDFIKNDKRHDKIKKIIETHCWEGGTQYAASIEAGYTYQQVSNIVREVIDIVETMDALLKDKQLQTA